MGAADQPLEDRKLCRQSVGWQRATWHSSPRTPEWHDDSKFSGATRSVCPKGMFRQFVEFSRPGVGLKLAIPLVSVELSKPSPELRQILSGEFVDLLLKLL